VAEFPKKTGKKSGPILDEFDPRKIMSKKVDDCIFLQNKQGNVKPLKDPQIKFKYLLKIPGTIFRGGGIPE